jgi:hypothetical protein
MMETLITTTTWPTSLLIRWGLKEKASHFAIAFDKKEVWHSSFFGLHLVGYKEFCRKNKIVDRLEWDLTPEDEEQQWQNLDVDEEVKYDYGAFFFFIWCGIKWRLFNLPFPTVNKWGNSKNLLCTGTGKLLIPILKPKNIADFEMLSPCKLFDHLKEIHQKFFSTNTSST